MDKEKFRSSLINASTPAETRLLQIIDSTDDLKGKVEFQKILDPYIVDFYFHAKKLAIEIDGSSHAEKTNYDNKRTKVIKDRYDVTIIRFTNSDVFKRPCEVVSKIRRYMKKNVSHRNRTSIFSFYGINPLAVPPKKKGMRKKKAKRRNKTVGTVTERTKSAGR
jgi:very-short-patch-repair endonuclease